MLIGTTIMASPQAAIVQATGLVAAHAYEFLTVLWPQYGGGGRNLLTTPLFVQKWFANVSGAPRARGAGTAFNTRATAAQNIPQRQTGSGGGWTSGGAWGDRGSGRRLGGD
jgi:Derlin-2/3